MQKRPEREQARSLYREGKTYPEIAAALGCAKSTVSLWCRDLVAEKRAARVEARDHAPKQERKILKGVGALAPYEGFLLYAQTGQDGVARVQLVRRGGERFMLTLARYRMSVHLGRRLGRDEMVVRHGSDELCDLELRKRNALTGKKTYQNICVICEEAFEAKKAKTETCSKDCKNILVSGILTDRAARNKLQN